MHCDYCTNPITDRLFIERRDRCERWNVCPDCADPKDYANPTPCCVCDRLFYTHHGDRPNPRDLCSDKCLKTLHNRARSVPHDPRPCDHCHQDFTPQRSTARFCSTKCRVYHSREKLRTTGT